jgi:hypothetical protein
MARASRCGSALKTRASHHDAQVGEFQISTDGITITQ